jgi:peptidoglycan/LPS O-acetylase OafA/YrhL
MKTKLPGLNGLRAIAASFVLFTHVFQIAGEMGDPWAKSLGDRHPDLGTEMVNLFFVISGFIITYILYKEKNETGTISLYRFYFKRALRIWPLYFGIIAIVYILTRTTGLYADFPELNRNGILSLFFFIVTFHPFVNEVRTSVLPHYWSLSVEEQFYIFWPPFFKYLSRKGVLVFCFLIIFGLIVARNMSGYMDEHYGAQYPWMKSLETLFTSSMFGSIAIGVIGAWLLVHNSPVLKLLYNRYLQLFCWAVLLSMVIYPFRIDYIQFELTAVVSLILVLNVTSNEHSVLKLEQKWLDKTGMISYGIYMFHWPLIPVLIYFSKQLGLWEFFVQGKQIPLLIISYLLTWGLAWLSYRFLESKILRLKHMNIKS